MKKVLITGGARGLGKEITTLFASDNYEVYVNYNNSHKEALKLKDKYPNIKIIKADISNEDEVKKMFKEISKLDVLINNAGIAIDNNYLNKTAEEFNKVLAINLTGTFLVSKYASTVMDEGVIINISSNNALNSFNPESIDYDASKAGVISLTHNFAQALAPKIRVNCICPGWINTDMTNNLFPEYKKEEEAKIMLNRFAEPKEIAELVYFLASDKASYINDAIIKIDGGIK